MIQSAIRTQLQESDIVSGRVRITRVQLYEKVWAGPMTTLSEEFGVSARGLAKSASAFDSRYRRGVIGRATRRKFRSLPRAGR
jgi:hypothetical protein